MPDSGTSLRFGVLDAPDAPLSTLVERWRLVEELGFDSLWLPDHTADYRNPGGLWLDGWTMLAAMALTTRRIRIGTLVSNPILRHPVMLARQAAAVDHLSDGRLELGIGTGIAGFDHDALGTAFWPPKERVQRFVEYVDVVDGLLVSGEKRFSFVGRYYTTHGSCVLPAPRQTPRPPLTIGGQSPTVLRVAAEKADCWNTHGPFGASVDEVLAITRGQSAHVDDLCLRAGRDPAALRRSLLLYGALDAWASRDALAQVVERFSAIGIREFVVQWPGDARREELERVAMDVVAHRPHLV